MVAITKIAPFLVTADTTDLLQNHNFFARSGKGVYLIAALAAAAADATITINDGVSDVVSADPVMVKAAAVTYPELVPSEVSWYKVRLEQGERLLVTLVDGTNAEILVLVQKIQ